MRQVAARSARISASAWTCAAVSEKGRAAAIFAERPPVALAGAARRAAQMRAHQRERELMREQFVIGEAHPGRRRRRDRFGVVRAMQRVQRRGEARQRRHFATAVIEPFRQIGQARQRRRDRSLQACAAEPLGQPIDRLDRWHAGRGPRHRARDRDGRSADVRPKVRACRKSSASRRAAGSFRSMPDWRERRRAARRRSRPRPALCRAPSTAVRGGRCSTTCASIRTTRSSGASAILARVRRSIVA